MLATLLALPLSVLPLFTAAPAIRASLNAAPAAFHVTYSPDRSSCAALRWRHPPVTLGAQTLMPVILRPPPGACPPLTSP